MTGRSFLFVSVVFLIQILSAVSAKAGDLVVFHSVGIDGTYRDPPAFETTDGFRGVLPPQPGTKFLDFLSSVPGEMAKSGEVGVYNPDDKPVLEFSITAGRRAIFGGNRRWPDIHGDINPFTSGINLSRLDPSSISLRFMTKYDSFFFESGAVPGWTLFKFDARFQGAGGFSSGSIGANPESDSAAPIITDIPLGAQPDKGQTLGMVTLDADVGVAQASAQYRVDSYVSLVVKNPLITTASAMRQGGPWGSVIYAENEYRQFMESFPIGSTERTRLENALPNYTLAQRGCAIASYAAAVNALGILPFETTQTLYNKLEIAGLVTDVSPGSAGIRSWQLLSSGQEIPRLNGANVEPTALPTLFPGSIWVRPTGDPNEIAKAIGSGFPVLINRSGGDSQHWVLANSAHLDASGNIQVHVFDPGRSDGSRDEDISLSSSVQARIVSDVSDGGGTINVHSPVSIKITDPLGRTAIFDPQGGLTQSSIPGSYFERLGPLISPDDAFNGVDIGPSSPDVPTMLYLPNLVSGTYLLEATGLANGYFSIDFSAPGLDKVPQSVLFESGMISAGEVRSFTALVVPEPPGNLLAVIAAMFLLCFFGIKRVKQN